ncbi:MAG: flavin reductase [Methylococcaceae bacterium]|nr:flavin reductase [Methylococcaceae bacterium]
MNSSLAELFGRISQGVYVVGVAAGERRNAFTAAWVMQTSFDPPMVALSINPAHSSFQLLEQGRNFTVNVLADDQLGLAAHFGKPASADKLAGQAWRPAPGGAPILRDALAWLDCRLDAVVNSGDHRLVTGVATGGSIQRPDSQPLLYRDTGALDGSAALYPAAFPAP